MVLHAAESVRCLAHISTTLSAERGGRGGPNACAGLRGADCVVSVPVGTMVWVREDASGGESAATPASGVGRNYRPALRELADLSVAGAEVVAACGGRGGRGNTATPGSGPLGSQRTVAEAGGAGGRASLLLELKAVADVGLVGPPNCGKSTLMASLTAARPAVGDYPFTTLRPQLGVLAGGATLRGSVIHTAPPTLADLPGLLPGAAHNVGLGHAFLRHVERCATLLLCVDLAAGRAASQLRALRAELAAYDPGLLHRPHIVVATKADAPGAGRALAALRASLHCEDTCVSVSAHSGRGVEELRQRLTSMAARDFTDGVGFEDRFSAPVERTRVH